MRSQELILSSKGCRIDDDAALAAVIEAVPEKAELRAGLVSGWSGVAQRYDSAQQRAFYIVCDGKNLVCHTIRGFAHDQGKQMVDLCSQPPAPGIAFFQKSIEQALQVVVRWSLT